MNEKIVAKILKSVSSFCIGNSGWDIKRITRPNKADVFQCANVFHADHTPNIPFIIDIQEYKPPRLHFPTSKARQDADQYGVREYMKETIIEALKEA